MLQNNAETSNGHHRPAGPGREFDFTDEDFESIRDLLKRRTGIHLADSKRDLAYARMARIVRERGLVSIGDYLKIVCSGDDQVLSEFVNALTTNVTSFFREPDQFEFLTKEYIPELLSQNVSTRKIRFWSSACSTGQEPYSIAMVMKESVPTSTGWSARILATDLDSCVLATAKAGVYSEDHLEGITIARRRAWFQRGKGQRKGSFRVSPELQSSILFRQLNLMDRWPMQGGLDAIFCRNVVIYFTKDTQRKLFDRMANLLEVGRCLFLGHSESLMGMSDRFEFCGKNVYRKIK